jgi:hypothetical protein
MQVSVVSRDGITVMLIVRARHLHGLLPRSWKELNNALEII